MRCPKCQKVSPKGYNRCAYCGAPLPVARSQGDKEEKMIKCPHCQGYIPEGSGYCRICSRRIDDDVDFSDNKPGENQDDISYIADIENTDDKEQKAESSAPNIEKGMQSFPDNKNSQKSVNDSDQDTTNKDDLSEKSGGTSTPPNKNYLIPILILASIVLISLALVLNHPDSNVTEDDEYSEDYYDDSDYAEDDADDEWSSSDSDYSDEYSDESYSDDTDYSDDMYEDSDSSNSGLFDYSEVTDLSNYEHVEGNSISFYAPVSLYDEADVDAENDEFMYYEYDTSDSIYFSSIPIGRYEYYFDTPDELLDQICEEKEGSGANIILKTYQSEDSEGYGYGRLVYDIPDEHIYCAMTFTDDEVYTMELSFREPESDEEAKWMDYYINVLYRGCSFTRYVGDIYTYDEYLEEQ